MYSKIIYTFPGSVEVEYHYAGNYGAKGEKRQAKKKPTPEQIKRQNQWNKEKRMRHILKANFRENDLFATIKYQKGTRLSIEETEKHLKAFFRLLRKEYKKQGEQLKYVYRMEIGARGGIHIHLVINRIRGKPDTDVLVQRAWKHGRVNFQGMYEQGGFKELAEYLTKQPDEECEKQMSFLPEERKKFIKYSCSRNLLRVKPEVKKYLHWTMRKILAEGPMPHPGYYIDKESIIRGVNQFTGLNYLYYTEYPLKKKHGPPEGEAYESG